MELRQYLDVLYRPDKTWFFAKDHTNAKLEALSRIADLGNPRQIECLTEFLKNDNIEIREATSSTIIQLFKKIDSKKGYYETLKHCTISPSDIDFYESNFPKQQYVELLAISSLNSNGYTREKAVIKLAQIESSRAIVFLIYRLADWVYPVRQAAIEGIETYKKTKYLDSLIEYFPIIDWIQKVERTDLSSVYQNIIEFIFSTNKQYVIENIKKYPDKIRILFARHLSSSLVENSKALSLFLTDRHFLVRNTTINHFEYLSPKEIEQLLCDKSAIVRLHALYRLKGRNNFETTVKNFLADDSAAIRQFSRYQLKEANIDFAAYYHNNLNENKHIVGSLSGLAETNGKQYTDTVRSFLGSKTARIKKTAFLALCKLDEVSAFDFSTANLDSPYLSLRNVLITFLIKNPNQEVLTRARSIFETGNHDLKISMLKLFNHVGGWAVIPDLMLATIDENETVREMALDYIQKWKSRAAKLFTTPKAGEIERAKQVFSSVNEAHQVQKHFHTNPVNGLDFFFR